MKNLKILLTGASQGIGAAIARRLHKSGHSLALVARSEDKLHSLNQELGGGHSVVRADLTELSSLPALSLIHISEPTRPY